MSGRVGASGGSPRRAWIFLATALAFPAASQVVSEKSGALNLVNGEYRITEDLGLVRGTNLFHGLTRLDVAAGETARFTGESAVANILTRVSGGSPTTIDGTLHTRDYPGANLYVFNPNGISVGPNGRLETDGDFHLSTANAIRLGHGIEFAMDTPLAEKGTFAIALEEFENKMQVVEPIGLRFADDLPAGIAVTGATLTVPAGASLSMVGGDLTFSGATLRAAGGRVVLAAVAAAGTTAGPLPGAGAPDLAGFERLGAVTLAGGTVDASGAGGGAVAIRGGRLVASARANVFASVLSDGAPPPDAGIDVAVRDTLRLEGDAVFGTSANLGVATPTGGVRLRGATVDIVGNPASGFFTTRLFSNNGGGGRSGDMRIHADEVRIRNGGSVQMQTFAPATGPSGEVVIEARRRVAVENRGLVFSLAFGGVDAADLRVEAPQVHVTSAPSPGAFTGVLSQTFGGGSAGHVIVRAERLDVQAGAQLSSRTFGPGPGGDVVVRAERLDVLTGAFVSTASGFGSTGAAGDIDVAPLANRLDVRVAGTSVANSGGLFANTLGSGPGGTVTVRANEVVVRDGASLQGGSLGSGPAGGVRIDASGRVTVVERGFVASGALFGTGAAADLVIDADELVIAGITGSRNFVAGPDFTGLSAATNVGHGGDIVLRVRRLDLRDKGSITTNSIGPGAAGDIVIDVDEEAVVSNGAQVLALALGAGPGGDVEFRGPTLRVVGVNPNPIDSVIGEFLAPSGLSSQTQSPTAPAGDVRIVADLVEVTGGAQIDTQTFGAGTGGTVDVRAGTVRVLGGSDAQRALTGNESAARSKISSSTLGVRFGSAATGAGGTVRVVADRLEVVGGEVSASTGSPGPGGAVLVEAGTVDLRDGGRVTTQSTDRADAGPAGRIAITARERFQAHAGLVTSAGNPLGAAPGGQVAIAAADLRLEAASAVTSENLGNGDAGSIALTASRTLAVDASQVTTLAARGRSGALTLVAGDDILLTRGASVSAETLGPGDAAPILLDAGDTIVLDHSTVSARAAAADGGNVKLRAPTLVALFDSTISAAVGGGAGTTGGNVDIDPRFVVLNRSAILANAFEGRGGNIRIVADYFFADPSSIVDASSQRSIDGTVIIDAPDTDLGEELAALPSNIVDPASQLAERCAARQGAAPATFTRAGRGGLPAAPGEPAAAALATGRLGDGAPAAAGPIRVTWATMLALAGCTP